MPHPFTIEDHVRWSDVDLAGIIFYGAYVRFFEIAETEMFRSAGVPFGEVFDRFGIWLPRVHLEADFHYPARLDDRLRVAAYVSRWGKTSITMNFDVFHISAGKICASGHEVLVAADRERLDAVPVPPGLQDLLGDFTVGQEEARAVLTEGQPG